MNPWIGLSIKLSRSNKYAGNASRLKNSHRVKETETEAATESLVVFQFFTLLERAVQAKTTSNTSGK